MPIRSSLLALALMCVAGSITAQHPYPPNKSVPATPRRGGGDCDSGQNICKPTRQDPEPWGTLTFADSGYSVTSDGGGPYVGGTANVLVAASSAAVLGFHLPPTDDKRPMRRINVDLRRPVPNGGGDPLGIISDSLWVDMNAQWYREKDFTRHLLPDMAVGSANIGRSHCNEKTIARKAMVFRFTIFQNKPACYGTNSFTSPRNFFQVIVYFLVARSTSSMACSCPFTHRSISLSSSQSTIEN